MKTTRSIKITLNIFMVWPWNFEDNKRFYKNFNKNTFNNLGIYNYVYYFYKNCGLRLMFQQALSRSNHGHGVQNVIKRLYLHGTINTVYFKA